MNHMIVMYNLADGQDPAEFETWLREVDLPGYAKLKSMSNPYYYRCGHLLGEDKPAPFRYIAVIEMDSPQAVENEMADPKWADFIADIEGRITDAHYVTAERILP